MTYAERDRIFKQMGFSTTTLSAPAKRRVRSSRNLAHVESLRQGAPAWERLNQSEIRRAARMLEVKHPLKVKRSNGVTKRGCHRYRDGVHCITVSKHSSIEDATKTVLHELTHAAQLERYLNEGRTTADFYQDYKDQTRRRGYKRNGYELEAKETASVYCKQFRIAS